MAEFTSIATRFWEDPYIQSLPPTDKLLYLYLIGGPQIEPTLGVYEVSLFTMAFHTALDKENIEHSLNRFAQADKIHHVDGWVILKNHFKHNPIRGNSRLVTGAFRRLEHVPWQIRERLTNSEDTLYIPYLDPKHSLYIGLDAPSNPSLSLPLPVPIPSHALSPSPGVDKSTGWGKTRENLVRKRSM